MIPDQMGGLFFADVQGPFEVKLLEGSVNKIGIIEAKTLSLWMTLVSSTKVDVVLDQWLKDISVRAQHALKGFQIQKDSGEQEPRRCERGKINYQLSLLTLDNAYY